MALAAVHPVLTRCYERHGALAPRGRTPVDRRFESLSRSIAYQQLAGRAASVVWGRVVDALGGRVDPEVVASVDPGVLRTAGLSGAKTAAVRDLADKVLDGTVDLRRAGRLDDDGVVRHLTVVRGIGPWTAQMFLIFDLGRLDVWPTGDLGVRNGFGVLFGHVEAPSAVELAELGAAFAPYRSVLAQWCWRAVDGDDADW